jgi:hypothetical protein
MSLADLFGPGPAPAAQPVAFRQGLLLSINAVTLANTVQVGGTVLTNLPLLGGEASLLAAGDVVGVAVVGGDAKTFYIIGQIVKPPI